jgi:uncharacterized protein RhaS with RHS repeats
MTTTAYTYDPANNIISGSYTDSNGVTNGYEYNTQTRDYNTYDFSGAGATTLYDDAGNELIGTFTDSLGTHGFLAPIPEPSGLALTAIAAGTIVARWRKFRVA